MDISKECRLCPRECGADRHVSVGFCGESSEIRIARAEPHFWEEPCISGTKGSGAVFFSGCSLRCCFCQNHEISQQSRGFKLSVDELADTFLRLQNKGVHNINLVNPTHFVPQIVSAVEQIEGELEIPLVYNSGGYDKPETLDMLGDRVKIFLPDLKYFDSELSLKYSGASDYFETAVKAIEKMFRIAGKPVIENGIMKSGVILRHMILPNHRKDSIRIIKELRERFAPDEIMVSLMSQYTPLYKASQFKEINRRVSTFEYKCVLEELEASGFDGFIQQRDSSGSGFVPQFYDEKYYTEE